MLLTRIATIDGVLEMHAAQLGRDFKGYRNHTYRVANLCAALSSAADPERLEKIAIAAAFHDLGIWTAGTFDYLPPSIRIMKDFLADRDRLEWDAELTAMILEHHKLTSYRPYPKTLTEPFRRADLVDVTMGAIRFGLPRSVVRELYALWPDAGFHRGLVRLALQRLVTHPWSPLPMLRA